MKKFLIILICIATIGCQKEHGELDSYCSTGIHYLKFESLEAFYDTVEYLQANNEIVEYASRNGFNSFYDKSHEIYNKLRNMSFESQDEIIAAFNEHQRFVDIADNDGELEAIEKLSSSFYKYFINEDQIVQVGEQLFKVLENNIVKTDLHNYNLLLSINDRDIQDLYKNANFKIQENSILHSKKDTGHPVAYKEEDKSVEQSKRRVKLEVEAYWSGIMLWRKYRIAAQKKILGIWFNYNVNITAEVKWRFDHFDYTTGNWKTLSEKYIYNSFEGDVLMWGRGMYYEENNKDYYHFRGYDCTATTADITNSADLEFNTSLIGYISPSDIYYPTW